MLAVHFGMADQFVRDLRSNVKCSNRAKLEHGGWPSREPLGYVNDKGTKTVQVDISQAKYVVRAFELYATGSYGLQDITDILHDEGFRTKSGMKIYRNQIQRPPPVLVLCGDYVIKWETLRGKPHTPHLKSSL